jgi:hypothetical protein
VSRPDLPKHDELADSDDELGWNTSLHGRMVEFASDDEPETVPMTLEEAVRAIHDTPSG